MYNIFYYLLLSFQAGKPLKAVAADCSLYSAQMIELRKLKIVLSTKILWQTILNLMGNSDCTNELTGREIDYDAAYEFASTRKNADGIALLEFFQIFVNAFFGDHEKGADLAIRQGDKLQRTIPGCKLESSCTSCNRVSSLILIHPPSSCHPNGLSVQGCIAF
jgi:hypothetical protein